MFVDEENRRILMDVPSHNKDMLAILEAMMGKRREKTFS